MGSKLEEYLARQLYSHFGHLSIRRNYRSDWLRTPTGTHLELDFYIEELHLAAEVNGEQHYFYNPFFHRNDKNRFNAQRERDAYKSYLCRHEKIRLIEIQTEKDADLFIAEIKEIIRPKHKFGERDQQVKARADMVYQETLDDLQARKRPPQNDQEREARMLARGERRVLRKQKKLDRYEKALSDYRAGLCNLRPRTIRVYTMLLQEAGREAPE